jgi:transcriptional regulator of aromatic amino acid metabolism
MSIDPSKLTVGNLIKEISGVADIKKLKEILVAEEKNKNRKGALEGIQEQIESVESLGPSGIAAPAACISQNMVKQHAISCSLVSSFTG